jgi:crotonobetainyl-CoA hydratase
MTAAEAARWGLANRVVPAAGLLPAAAELAEAICAAAPLAVGAVLEILRATEASDVRRGFDILRTGDLPGYHAMLGSADAHEGAQAFAERRKPVWRGQ